MYFTTTNVQRYNLTTTYYNLSITITHKIDNQQTNTTYKFVQRMLVKNRAYIITSHSDVSSALDAIWVRYSIQCSSNLSYPEPNPVPRISKHVYFFNDNHNSLTAHNNKLYKERHIKTYIGN